MERRFVKTGIPGLDEILGGGLLEGSISALTGPTGCGKSTLAAQFIYGGAVESGDTGLYLAIEESKKEFMFHMSGYAWDFSALERERKFVFLDYPIYEVDQIINQASAIQEIINSTGTKRVVIDSIMPVALYFKGEEERKRGFLKFIENLRKWNTTTLIISEDTKMAEAMMPGSEFGIERFTDGWINLFFKYDEKSMERKRYVEVIKMKGIAHSSRSFPAMMGDMGFSIVHELMPKARPEQKKPEPKKHEAPPEIEEEVERVFAEKPHRLMKPVEMPAPSPPPEAPAKPRAERPEARKPEPPPAKAEPPKAAKPAPSGVRRLLKDEEFEQLKKLLAETGDGDEGETPPKPPAAQKAAPKAAKGEKRARPPPAKMSPSIAQKIAEAKKKLMKK